MLKIGLTGGIGTGKSTVASIFSVLNIPVSDADQISKTLVSTDPELQSRIIEHFGTESFNADGSYNTKFIAGIVFNDSEQLQQLNSLIHPYVNRYTQNWWAKQSEDSHVYAIKEAAILIESQLNQELDYIIGVSASLELRISRIQERDNISQHEILSRMNRQMDNDEKMALCDFVIHNDDTSSLIEQVLHIHNKLIQIHQL